MTGNYYIVLGVDIDASQHDIKTAYRKRVMEFHPDHYGENCDPFLAVQEAYRTLNDPEKRRKYDQSLKRSRKKPHTGVVEPLIPEKEPRTTSKSVRRTVESMWSPFDELFDMWRSPHAGTSLGRLETLTLEVPISSRQAAHGGLYRIIAPVQTECPMCRGRGVLNGYDCRRCGGAGYQTTEYPLSISMPSGIRRAYSVRVPLEQVGVQDFELVITFRVHNF